MERISAPIFQVCADWQKLLDRPPGSKELHRLLRRKEFYTIPKRNDQLAKQHAVILDKIFGFDLKTVESRLVKQGQAMMPHGSFEYWGPLMHEGVQTWVGLDAQTLNTPYSVLWRLCELLQLRPGTRVVDLGAAHGRLGLVMEFFCRGAQFLGLEYVSERVHEANRIYEKWGCTHARCEVQDLFAENFVLPEMDVYFIYDYGKHEHINATLDQIGREADRRPIRLVARGKFTNKLIEDYHPWLNMSYEGVMDEHFNIYHADPRTRSPLEC